MDLPLIPYVKILLNLDTDGFVVCLVDWRVYSDFAQHADA